MRAVRRRNAKPKLSQWIHVRFVERMQEEPRYEILAVIAHFNVSAPAIFHAVEVAHLVSKRVTPDFAVELHPYISIRHELRRQSTFDEQEVRARLQTLQSDWLLHLAKLELGDVPMTKVDIAILEKPVVARSTRDPGCEIQHQTVVEILPHGPFKNRP